MKAPNRPGPPEERLRPFRRLAASLSPAFLDEATELLFLVRQYGAHKHPTIPTDRSEYLRFVAHVHDGWKKAQTRIAAFLIDALKRRQSTQEELKTRRVSRDKAGAEAASITLNDIEIEILVLRRTLDVILWTITVGDHSTLRRLVIAGGTHSLSIKNINDAMPTADALNVEPHTVAICNDMLSLVHVGDLLVVNSRIGKISFMELKAGDKNFLLSKTAEFATTTECQRFDDHIVSMLNPTDVDHYARAKRQIKRNHQILNTIRNEAGEDPNTGARVQISSIPDPPEFWVETIVHCYQRLTKDKPWAVATVDECVHVGVYTDLKIALVGFNTWMHAIKCTSPIYNLTDSFLRPMVRPLGATFLPHDLLVKILRGEVFVIICLDLAKLITFANKLRPDFLGLALKKETAQARTLKLVWLELDGRIVRARVDTDTKLLGGGFRDRIVFDQQRPSQLLKHQLQLMLKPDRDSGDSKNDAAS